MAASPHTDNLLKELALLVQQGRFKETRDWLEAGKPFRDLERHLIGFTGRREGTRPSHDLQEFVGEYSNPGYGLVTIALADSLGDRQFTLNNLTASGRVGSS